MAEDQFERIERWQQDADGRFARIDERFDRVDERFDRVDDWRRGVNERFDRIDARFEQIDQRADARFDELARYMRVLYEDLVDRMKGSSERNAATKAEVADAIAASEEKFDRRIRPLEVAVREHSKDIDRLKRRRP